MDPGQATKSLYHYELLILPCCEFGFHLAQEFFWWNPARLPTPAEWVTVRRTASRTPSTGLVAFPNALAEGKQ